MTIHLNGGSQEYLGRTLEAKTHTFETMQARSDIVEHYKDTYGTNWKTKIVDALVEQTGRSRNTVSREFENNKKTGRPRYESSRMNQATKDKYQKLGKKLPPIKKPKNMNGKKATVTITVVLWFSGKPYEKTFERTLNDSQTGDLLEGNIDGIIEAYQINPDDVEEADIEQLMIDFDEDSQDDEYDYEDESDY